MITLGALVREAERRGFVVMPARATKEMIVAAEAAIEVFRDETWDSGPDGEGSNSREFFQPGVETAVYDAMVAARPLHGG